MNEAHGHDEASGVKRRRYVPDCGTSTHKFLSYAAAIQTRKFYRPGRESGGERRSYAVCEDFGAHQPRCLQRCGLLCLAVFACQYAIDKFLFSKFYAIPQTLTNQLALLFSSFVPTAVFLRTCVAIWMWTNPDIVANDVAGVGAMATTAPGANATAAAGYAFFDDGGGGGPLALERLGHRNAAPHVVVLAVLLCMVARKVLRVALNDVGFARDAVAGVLARCGCCDAAAFFRDLIEQQGYNFPDYFQALSTACLERKEEGRRSLQSPTALFSSPRTVPWRRVRRAPRAREGRAPPQHAAELSPVGADADHAV